LEIPCSEKSAKSETSNFGLRFFFKFHCKKRKVAFFCIFKKRILELCLVDVSTAAVRSVNYRKTNTADLSSGVFAVLIGFTWMIKIKIRYISIPLLRH